jgi:hypothetical protein
MNSFRATVRRALDRARRFGPSLGLAAVLLTSTLGAAVPAGASDLPRQVVHGVAQAQGGDTAARIQIIVRSINVVNDRDGAFRGSGEFAMTTSFWRCSSASGPCVSGDGLAALVAESSYSFSADSGDFKVLDRLMPVAADVKDGALASEDSGFALHAGQRYVFQVSMFERDTVIGDNMGGIQQVLDESNQWGLGLHLQEPARPLMDRSLITGDICAGCGGVIVGDYLVTYEIVRTELPDLRPTAIRVLDRAPGATDDEVCLEADNSGLAPAGPFDMKLYVDGSQPPNGGAVVAGLAAHATHETCIRTSLPTTGVHDLLLIVDEPRLISEMDEYNNSLKKSLDRGPVGGTPTPVIPILISADPGSSTQAGPGAAPSPMPGLPSSAAQADLTVSAIRVKNTGAGKAEGFAVRLVVDDAQGDADDQSVNGLEPGKEREVRFGDVRLKKDEHTLTATADAKGTVAESNDKNNDLRVTVRCNDDD